ncbi:MAG TPA: hypothetical protein VFQ76_09430 [Longimicrobiaceae bacterium]|nr:hypothetical protein [Longimicrobiaceae bacterium]
MADQQEFVALEGAEGVFNDKCRGDACGSLDWEVRHFPQSNLVRSIQWTNAGDRPIAISAEWGNILGGCGVVTNLTIAPGRTATAQFSQAQSILGYCKFSARFRGAVLDDATSGREELAQLKGEAGEGTLEAVVSGESATGNQVSFYKRGNVATLRMANRTEEYQRTDYVVEVKVDGAWRLHTEGYFDVAPMTDYSQGFHQWRAEDWSAQWQ